LVKLRKIHIFVGEALQQLSKAFVKAYEGSVLVTAVVTDVAHTRRAARSPDDEDEAPPEDEEPPPDATPPGDDFDANFAAVFNLMLWFGIAYCFSLIAIVYTLMDMDPGRDSIIYRMTSIRMKKEN
ncbi:uncharacterized protein LOC142976814, partial [Anticarsia gemmatalis]|uniref:uncharacterized protein LOC142976814 n=1 Tax=Anticarsia gemmatalis TaxID=129554 RepID=UPI003F75EC5C